MTLFSRKSILEIRICIRSTDMTDIHSIVHYFVLILVTLLIMIQLIFFINFIIFLVYFSQSLSSYHNDMIENNNRKYTNLFFCWNYWERFLNSNRHLNRYRHIIEQTLIKINYFSHVMSWKLWLSSIMV